MMQIGGPYETCISVLPLPVGRTSVGSHSAATGFRDQPNDPVAPCLLSTAGPPRGVAAPNLEARNPMPISERPPQATNESSTRVSIIAVWVFVIVEAIGIGYVLTAFSSRVP